MTFFVHTFSTVSLIYCKQWVLCLNAGVLPSAVSCGDCFLGLLMKAAFERVGVSVFPPHSMLLLPVCKTEVVICQSNNTPKNNILIDY